MRTLLVLVTSLIVVFAFWGCTERKDPVYPEWEYAFNLVAQKQTPGWAQDVYYHNDTLFVADDEQRLTVYNVADLSNPVEIMRFETRGSARQVHYAPKSGFIFIAEATEAGGVQSYKFPEGEVGNTFFSGTVMEFNIKEPHSDTIIVAGADYSDGLVILTNYWDQEFEIWENANPMYNAKYDINAGSLRGFHFDYDYAYLAINQLGIVIAEIDYSIPTTEKVSVLGELDTPGAARDIVLNHDKTHAIIADYQAGLVVVNVTDKANPRITGSILPEGVDEAFKVECVDDIAYFLDEYNGMFAVDISNPADPKLIGRYDTPEPQSIFVTENHTIFIADEDLGVIILEWKN